MSSALFDLINMNVVYDDVTALRRITLRIMAGEKIAVVGPCGAGKSTLLGMLHQLRPDECAVIHQHDTLQPRFSAFYNIYLGRPRGRSMLSDILNFIKPRQKAVANILPVMQSIGMEKKMFVAAARLSAPERQRVAVGRALYQDKPILLADEPMASVDWTKAADVVELITATDKTVVMALHSVELSLKYATRIVGLCAGSVRFDLPAENTTPDHITALYVEC